jgi:hypothetical protein
MAILLDRALTIGPRSAEVLELVERCSANGDAARSLVARVLLHLPRLADENGQVPAASAHAEVHRLAVEQAAAPAWMERPERAPQGATDLEFGEFDAARARVVLEQFHYLRSYRPESLHLAGTADEHMAALLTFSPLDLGPIAATLPERTDPAHVLVLSRVYAAGWAPRNSLSRLLALAARWLRDREPSARLLLTYLNPNVGFDGASYKAANWRFYGRETGTRYAYLDAAYVTDRELTYRFGTSDAGALQRLLGDRIAFSRMRLEPLELYAFALDPRLRHTLVDSSPREWSRPWA